MLPSIEPGEATPTAVRCLWPQALPAAGSQRDLSRKE